MLLIWRGTRSALHLGRGPSYALLCGAVAGVCEAEKAFSLSSWRMAERLSRPAEEKTTH